VLVTNRTARFLRPADGMERVFRDAAIGLAKQHPFARQLVNTGRMAVANPYTPSARLRRHRRPVGAERGARWADGSPGTVNDLLQWADGHLLLLVFGDLSRRHCSA
jgi:3-(3-hydroxy-phenyl)propionate hydroxylase